MLFSLVPIFGERLSVSCGKPIQVSWLFGEKNLKGKDFSSPTTHSAIGLHARCIIAFISLLHCPAPLQ